MSQLLQYTYATIDLETGECYGCMTYSFEIINEAYIPVPTLDDYVGKYYKDGLWYVDSEFTILAEGLN